MSTLATARCGAERLSGVRSNAADHSADSHRAARFLREAQKNRRLIEKLEKERTLSAQCRKSGWTDVSAELDEYERKLEEERNVDKIHLQKQLVKIHHGVKKYQRHITDVKPTPELIARMAETMSEVEILVSTLKEEWCLRLEGLLREESKHRHDITTFEKEIGNGRLALKSDPTIPRPPTATTKPPDKDLPAEVRALEAFLQKTGGPYGGWDQDDHQAFLKVWTKHSGKPAYRTDKIVLPDKTLEEIEQHEDWHQELIYLQDKKRQAIQQWKATKLQERQTRSKSKAHLDRTEEQRMETAQQLKEWREEKIKKVKEKQELRLADESQKKKQAKEENRKQLEVKLTIKKQPLQREEEEEEEEGEEKEQRRREEEQIRIEKRRREASKRIKCFSERDIHKVKAKLKERQLREKEEEERKRRIAVKLKEKMDGHVSRDPSRLTRPTKGWEKRMKQIGPSGRGPLLQLFHRAIPNWRQDL